MVRVAILGVTGYSGEELVRLLLAHPQVEITYVAGSARFERPQPIAGLYPDLPKALALTCGALDVAEAGQRSDVCFLALPHGQAMHLVPSLLDAGKRVIDLSGDFRLGEAAYQRWYRTPHAALQLLDDAVYGLTEFFRDEIREARLIANPGCYATSILLGVLPFVKRFQPVGPIIVDAKSGFSGAGREAAKNFQKDEPANLRPYKALDEHQHLAEIRQTIAQIVGRDWPMLFTPHIIPAERGLLSDIYLSFSSDVSAGAVQEVYDSRYGNNEESLICWRGTRSLPGFTDVAYTNRCDIGMKVSDHTVLIVSALDNLRKGAASQAIQNMNLMCGFDETTGLV